FKWANLASYNAGVIVVVVGLSNHPAKLRKLFSISSDGVALAKEVENINPYLVAGPNVIVSKLADPLSDLMDVSYGNYPRHGNYLTLIQKEPSDIVARRPDLKAIVRPVFGAQEFIKGLSRFCLWIDDDTLALALSDPEVASRIEAVRQTRIKSRDVSL